jgi:hypothetical protein
MEEYVTFPWPPVEAALSNFNIRLLLKTVKELIKTNEVAFNIGT